MTILMKLFPKIGNIDELPDKFVLKCNHGSNMNIFCKDKSTFNLANAKSQFP